MKENNIKSVGINYFYEYYSRSYYKEKVGNRMTIHKNSKFYLTRSNYCAILSDFNKAIIGEIIYDNFEFILPARLGTLSIVKIKPTVRVDKKTGKIGYSLPINWKATKELWADDIEAKEKKILVRHLNEHTNGYLCKWRYSKHKATYRWKSAYSFLMCRPSKNELAKFLQDPTRESNYYIYDNSKKYV